MNISVKSTCFFVKTLNIMITILPLHIQRPYVIALSNLCLYQPCWWCLLGRVSSHVRHYSNCFVAVISFKLAFGWFWKHSELVKFWNIFAVGLQSYIVFLNFSIPTVHCSNGRASNQGC